jgi:hypothetical protein
MCGDLIIGCNSPDVAAALGYRSHGSVRWRADPNRGRCRSGEAVPEKTLRASRGRVDPAHARGAKVLGEAIRFYMTPWIQAEHPEREEILPVFGIKLVIAGSMATACCPSDKPPMALKSRCRDWMSTRRSCSSESMPPASSRSAAPFNLLAFVARPMPPSSSLPS